MDNHEDEARQLEKVHVYDKWDEYDLKEGLIRGIYANGFDTPSFIQKTAIMPIIMGRDIRAQAQSGMGKTAAFGIGALQRLSGAKKTEVLILVSTREIAEQNALRINSLAQYMNVSISVISGGTDINKTGAQLRQEPEIVVGTPGRVFHMINEGFLNTRDISLLIIDEADEMLNRGFKDQVESIFEYLPENAQVAMFSATWEQEAIDVANEVLVNPIKIDLRHDEQTLKGIDQYFISMGVRPHRGADMAKFEVLLDIFQRHDLAQCVVFVNTRNKAKFLYTEFCRRNIPCDVMHSELTQRDRVEVLERFRNGSGRLLIATGIIGRGIDIQQLSLVFNFDIPNSNDKSNYIHRIGRAGRFGKKGKAVNFIFEDEIDTMKDIERHYKTSIAPLPNNLNFLGK